MASSILQTALGEVEFDPDKDDNVWETRIEWSGRNVEVDLWFDGATMSSGMLEGVARFVTDVAGFDELARHGMRQDFDALVEDYLDFDGADDLLRTVFATEDRSAVDAATFLAPMRLVHIALHLDEPGASAVYDYTLGSELTDNLVAVKFDSHGRVADIVVES